MAGTNSFQVEGIVLNRLVNGTYRLKLANGHRLLGFLASRAGETHAGFVSGETVKINLTPYDLSSGRILVGTKKI